MSPKTLAAIALIATPFGSAMAQTLQPKAGDRVRITAESFGLTNQVARVESVRNDTLVLQLASKETQGVPIAALSRLDLSTGRTRHTLQGAGIGALVGVGAGAIAGFSSGDDDPHQFLAFTAGEKAALGAIVLGGAGLVIGTVVGALNVTDKWTSLPLGGAASATPSIEIGGRGARLGMSISF